MALILALPRVDAAHVADAFRAATPVRVIGAVLLLIGAGLGAVWIGMWAAYVLAGRPTPVEPEAFKIVAALDLAMMVPALTTCAVLLWLGRPWGYLLAAMSSVQGALYLLVLSVNAVNAVRWGVVAAPGEVPLWGGLLCVTTAAALTLLMNVRGDGRQRKRPAMPAGLKPVV